jgi:hypothetical protein
MPEGVYGRKLGKQPKLGARVTKKEAARAAKRKAGQRTIKQMKIDGNVTGKFGKDVPESRKRAFLLSRERETAKKKKTATVKSLKGRTAARPAALKPAVKPKPKPMMKTNVGRVGAGVLRRSAPKKSSAVKATGGIVAARTRTTARRTTRR